MSKKILSLSLMSSLFITGCSAEESQDINNDEYINTLEQDLENAYSYIDELEHDLGIEKQGNETVGFSRDRNEEEFRLTVTQVTNNQKEFPDYMQGHEEYNTARMVAIQINYENINYPDIFGINTHEFPVYTTDGQAFERISQQFGQDEVTQEHSAEAQIYFKYPEGIDEVDSIEMDYTPKNEVLATFELLVD